MTPTNPAAPPAGSEPVKHQQNMELRSFNINGYVRVRLTERGRTELRRQDQEMNDQVVAYGRKPYGQTWPVEVDGWSVWQLWNLMHRLGPICFMGPQPPFETTIVLQLDSVA